MNDFAVRLRGVGKHYPPFSLHDVALDVPTGSITGFIGANGAGKSTTIRILMGLVTADVGDVEVLGHRIPAATARAKQDIGYVSEDTRLFPRASLQWHMEFVARVFGAWDADYATSLLRRFDLRAEQRIKGMSHGQRIKAALLLALARRPRLLVLDEPTTGLDPVARQEVIGALTEVLRDPARSVLFSSQNTLDVEQIADRVSFIDRGRIIDADDTAAYLDRWRRLRLELAVPGVLPALPHVVQATVHGHVATVVTDRYDETTVDACRANAVAVQGVERLTLEEIFVTTVMARREEVAA
ncbi:MAG TPA: ABC transporter ATP-binding protein [Gemmatimonadales bacterium]|nr:ABC transporter ATP-binding protein [Gemmatimonadales bacterium]